MSDGVAGLSPAGRIVLANPAMGLLVGRSVEYLLGKTPEEAWHEESSAPAGSQEETTNEVTLRRANGKRRVAARRAFVLQSDPPIFVSIYRDLTRRRESEAQRQLAVSAMRQTEERLASLLASIHDGVFSLSPDATEVLYLNAAAERLIGATREALAGSQDWWQQRVAPEDHTLVQEALGRVALQGQADVELRVTQAQGAARWLLLRGSLLRDERGVAQRLDVIATDVTDRHRHEEAALRDALLLSSLSEAVIFTDLAGVIQRWNDGATRMFRLAEQEALGTTLWSHGATPWRLAVRNLLNDRRYGEGVVGEFEDMRRGGVPMVLDVTSRIVNDAAGRPVGMLSIARDTTERHRSEERQRLFTLMTERLSTATSEREAAEEVAQAADGLFAWDTFFLTLYDPERDMQRFLLAFDLIAGQRQEARFDSEWFSISPLSRRVIDDGPLRLNRQELYDLGLRYVTFGGTDRRSQSLLYVPIRRAGRVIGILSVQSYEEGRFSDADLRSLQTLADLAGGALERLRIEARLRASEAYFRAAAQASMDAFYLLRAERDARGRITDFVFLDVNPIGAKLISRTPDQVIGQWLCELLPINRTAGFFDKYVRVVETREPLLEEFAIDAAEVKARWLSHQVLPLEDGIAIMTRDVTAFRDAQGKLEFQANVLRAIREAVVVMGVQGEVVYWNEGATVFFGTPTAEALGAPLATVLPSLELPAVDRLQDFQRDREGQKFEQFFQRRDGGPLWIEGRWSRLQEPGGELHGFLLVATDTTERRRAEEEARRGEAKNRSLLAALPDLIFELDAEGRYMDYRAERREDLYLPPERFIGKTLREVLPPEVARLIEDAIQAVRRSGRLQIIEYRLKMGEGDQREFEARVAPTSVGNFLLIVRNITERKRSERERQQLQEQMKEAAKLESLGLMAGGVAHDFNNLLSGVLGHAGLAMADLPPNSPAIPALQSIETTARRMADLTRQLLAYSGRGRFVVEVFDVNQLVTEMLGLLRVSITRKVQIETKLHRGVASIRADQTQIRQVVMNLITNAAEAIGDRNGRIVLKTAIVHHERAVESDPSATSQALPGDYVQIEVIDDGAGMAPETMRRIFEPFFTTKFTGRGLGLAAVQGIVRGHRGAIQLESVEGLGTTFRVLLPHVKGVESSPLAPRTPSSSWSALGTILVADDEDVVRDLVAKILKRAGFTPLMARDGIEALEVFSTRQREIVAVLLDITMPRLGGEEVLAELRRASPNLPIILMSGFTEQEVSVRFAGKRISGVLHKPFQTADLLALLRAALERPAPIL